MPIKHHIVGKRFGKWEVLAEAPSAITKGGHKRKSFCRCDCGKEKVVFNQDLIKGTSTGCLKCKRPSTLRHGHARRGIKNRTYEIWSSMIARCTRTNSKSFKDYGGRGIKVCERWFVFDNFIADMGERPDGLMLERKNNNGDYEPSNCKWATRTEQNRNSRRNHVLTVQGVTGCISKLAEHFGVPCYIINSRLRYGWTPEDAVLKPIRRQ